MTAVLPVAPVEAPADPQLLAAALDALPELMVVLDQRGCVVAANRAWERHGRERGLGDAGGVGTDYLAVCRRSARTGDDLAGHVLEGLGSVLDGTLGRFEADYPVWEPEGRRWFTLTAVPRTDGPGAVVTHRDVTWREEEADRLHRSNRRLDDLGRALAAEVAQPVTALVVALRQLERCSHGALDAVGDRLVAIAIESGAALGRLTADLVAHARDDVPDPLAEAVDVTTLARAMLHELHAVLGHDLVTVDVEPLPVVTTDPVQLRAALAGIIGAMTASRPVAPRTMALTGERTSQGWSLTVAEAPTGAADEAAGPLALASCQAAAARLGGALFTGVEDDGTRWVRLVLPDRDARPELRA